MYTQPCHPQFVWSCHSLLVYGLPLYLCLPAFITASSPQVIEYLKYQELSKLSLLYCLLSARSVQ